MIIYSYKRKGHIKGQFFQVPKAIGTGETEEDKKFQANTYRVSFQEDIPEKQTFEERLFYKNRSIQKKFTENQKPENQIS